MDTVINMTALLAVTVVSVQMAFLLNWALLSMMLKAMSRVKSDTGKGR